MEGLYPSYTSASDMSVSALKNDRKHLTTGSWGGGGAGGGQTLFFLAKTRNRECKDVADSSFSTIIIIIIIHRHDHQSV